MAKLKRAKTNEARAVVQKIVNKQRPNTSVDKSMRGVHLFRSVLNNVTTINNPVPPIKDWEWACVVTTAPRKAPTIKKSINSIISAGWEPTIFAEPESVKVDGVKWVQNEIRLGAFHNWLKAIKYAIRSTTVKYVLSAQDDALFHPESKQFVERIMFPTRDTGFISLYTPKHYSTDLSGNLKPTGINQVQTSSLWGACALVLERDTVVKLLDHTLTQNWTGVPPNNLTDIEKTELIKTKKENPHTIQNVDSLIGKVMNSLHLRMFFVDPSPVSHISVESSIGHGTNTGKRNCLRLADFTKPLYEQVMKT